MAFFRRAELWACLGALAFAGCVISDDDGETEASTSGPTTMSTTNTPTSTAGDDSGTMGMSTAGTADDTAGDTAGTAGDTAGDTAGTTAGDTGPGGDATEACLAACELGLGCEKEDPAQCAGLCDEAVGFAERDGCVAEFVAQQNCVGALDCTQYFDWIDSNGDPYPCQAEDEALFACEDAATGGSSSGGADSSSGG